MKEELYYQPNSKTLREEPQVLTRWQDTTIEQLQQENKQLKRILQEIYERAINTNITSLDFRDYILEILGDKE